MNRTWHLVQIEYSHDSSNYVNTENNATTSNNDDMVLLNPANEIDPIVQDTHELLALHNDISKFETPNTSIKENMSNIVKELGGTQDDNFIVNNFEEQRITNDALSISSAEHQSNQLATTRNDIVMMQDRQESSRSFKDSVLTID